MALFVIYVYVNRDIVVVELQFAFRTFNDENLQRAIQVLTVTLIGIVVTWIIIQKKKLAPYRMAPDAVMNQLFGRLDSFRVSHIVTLLMLSFFSAGLLFATNTTVLDVSYPTQRLTQWAPTSLLNVPVLIAALTLGVTYYKYLNQRSVRVGLLTLVHINMVITLILMLLVIGSRGLYTFLWLIAGLFEGYFYLNRKSSPIWAVLFLILAWFSYYSWPFLRAHLSIMPSSEALIEALQIGVFWTSDSSSEAFLGFTITLGDYAMIGASLFHLLYVIDLLEEGISLAGSTFTNLIPQSLPAILDGILWDRPENDNWRLADQYTHQGGFLVVANVYWNGGLWVVLAFVCVLTYIFLVFDDYLGKQRASSIYRSAYWLGLPVMVIQLGYGIQGMARVVELLVVAILFEKVMPRRAR
jgi:hypothetical protein